MAAFKHLDTGKIKHVFEGSWQHDYMRYSPLWAEATAAEVAASVPATEPEATPPQPEPAPAPAPAPVPVAEHETKPKKRVPKAKADD